jgi:DNA-binding HxlR family transcriptional regulator
MVRSPFEDQVCSVAQALAELGERWTLLILREAFFGTQRFTDFQQRLGIARNILAARLDKLVTSGILTVQDAEGRGNPRLYRLTEKGRDAIPAFIALMQWGDRWINRENAPIRIVEAATGAEISRLFVRAADGRPLAPRDMRVIAGPGADGATKARFGGTTAEPAARALNRPATRGSTT